MRKCDDLISLVFFYQEKKGRDMQLFFLMTSVYYVSISRRNIFLYTPFTKRHFVRHKNPQKLDDTHIIPFLFLSLNLDSVFKFIQRPPNGSQFSFFFKNFTYNFFVYVQIVANFITNHPTSRRWKQKHRTEKVRRFCC